jgi:amphi-Trp domain-containing protein
MVVRTDDSRELGRADVAALFRELADEFERGRDTVSVPVGNKTVALRPPDDVTTEVEVLERSGMFRGDQERLRIDVRWQPAKQTEDEAEPIGQAGERPES